MNAQAKDVTRPHRGTIFEERAEVLAHERFAVLATIVRNVQARRHFQ